MQLESLLVLFWSFQETLKPQFCTPVGLTQLFILLSSMYFALCWSLRGDLISQVALLFCLDIKDPKTL